MTLLLDGRELGVPLIGDEMKQRVANPLVGNLQHGLPFRPAGVVAEFDIVPVDGSKLHLEVVVTELRRIQTDIFLPLPEIVCPVVECADSRQGFVSPSSLPPLSGPAYFP